MADLQSARVPVTIHLPGELVDELTHVAKDKGLSFDECITEACAAFADQCLWEEDYGKWRQTHADGRGVEDAKHPKREKAG